jgi:hypothetical protein
MRYMNSMRGWTIVTLLSLFACGGSDLPPPTPVPAPPETAAAPDPVATAAPPPTASASAAAATPPDPKASTPTATAPSDPPPAATSHEIEGTLKGRKGKEVTLHFAAADAPAAGAKGSLSKYFEGKQGQASPLGALSGLLGGSVTGWLQIADVTVKSASGGDVTVVIDTEKSSVVVNGKPVNQFTPGAKVRLTLQ